MEANDNEPLGCPGIRTAQISRYGPGQYTYSRNGKTLLSGPLANVLVMLGFLGWHRAIVVNAGSGRVVRTMRVPMATRETYAIVANG